MLKERVLVSVFVCLSTSIFAPGIFAQDKPKDAQAAPAAEFKIPAEDSKKTNPLKNDAAAVADGKKLFSSERHDRRRSLLHSFEGQGRHAGPGRSLDGNAALASDRLHSFAGWKADACRSKGRKEGGVAVRRGNSG
jgi:hypothetical protein